MSTKIKIAVKAVLAGAALSVASTGVYAGTVTLKPWTAGDNVVGANETITSVAGASFGSNNGWTDNSALLNSAWGHAVNWYTFEVTAANQIVTLKDTITAGSRSAAFTVWASNGTFDGGSAYGDETNSGSASGNAPHSFNAVGQLGAPGTLWASDPSIAKTNPSIDPLVTVGGGNLLKTLAYVNAGNAHTNPASNDWNEVINAGVNQVDTSGTYFTNVSGNFSTNVAQLVFQNLATGWYAVALGGANSSSIGSAQHQFSVSTSAVPVPGAVYLFGSALAGLAASVRRKQ